MLDKIILGSMISGWVQGMSYIQTMKVVARGSFDFLLLLGFACCVAGRRPPGKNMRC